MEYSRQIKGRVRLALKKLSLDQRWRLRTGAGGDWRGPWAGKDFVNQE